MFQTFSDLVREAEEEKEAAARRKEDESLGLKDRDQDRTRDPERKSEEYDHDRGLTGGKDRAVPNDHPHDVTARNQRRDDRDRIRKNGASRIGGDRNPAGNEKRRRRRKRNFSTETFILNRL